MEKEKWVEIFDKVLEAKKIMKDVDEKVKHCSNVRDFLFYYQKDFLDACKCFDLEIETVEREICYIHSAHYKDLEIRCVEYKNIKEEGGV